MKKWSSVLLIVLAFSIRAHAIPDHSLERDEKKELSSTEEDILGDVDVKALYSFLGSKTTEENFKKRLVRSEAWAVFMHKVGNATFLEGEARRDLLQFFLDDVLTPYLRDNIFPRQEHRRLSSDPEAILDALTLFDDMPVAELQARVHFHKIGLSAGLMDKIRAAMKEATLEQAVLAIGSFLADDFKREDLTLGYAITKLLLTRILEQKCLPPLEEKDLISHLLGFQKKSEEKMEEARFCGSVLKKISDERMLSFIVSYVCSHSWTDKTFSMIRCIFQGKKITSTQASKILNKLIQERAAPEEKERKDLKRGRFFEDIPLFYGENPLDHSILEEVLIYLRNEKSSQGLTGMRPLFTYLAKHHFKEILDFFLTDETISEPICRSLVNGIKESLASRENKATSEQIKELAYKLMKEHDQGCKDILLAVFQWDSILDEACLDRVAPLFIRYFFDCTALDLDLIARVLKCVSGTQFLNSLEEIGWYYGRQHQKTLSALLERVSLDRAQLDKLIKEVKRMKGGTFSPEKELARAIVQQRSFDASCYTYWKDNGAVLFYPFRFLEHNNDEGACRKIVSMFSEEIFKELRQKLGDGIKSDNNAIKMYLMYVTPISAPKNVNEIFAFYLEKKPCASEVYKVVSNLQERCGKENLLTVKNRFCNAVWGGECRNDLASILYAIHPEWFPQIFQPWEDRNFTEIIAQNKGLLSEAQKKFVIGQMEDPEWMVPLLPEQEERAKEVVRMLKQTEKMGER